VQITNSGATSAEWAHFAVVLGLTPDLLPVVSNQAAIIDPASSMRGLGKTPSRYNGSRRAVGFGKWTQYTATDANIRKWSSEPDYGICLQTRDVRALDIDVDDAALAQKIRAVIRDFDLPERYRKNASKCLFAFHLAGDFTKRKFKTTSGIVEFLATGQQFIACGTHPSGARYEWQHGGATGLPDEIPDLPVEDFEALWELLVEQFAIEDSATVSSASTKHVKLAEAASNDPVAQQLLDLDVVLKVERDGRLHITCPWEDQHTTTSAESATTYWPAHTGGYVHGHFACLHAHCAHRTDGDFKAALGITDADVMSDFDNLTLQDGENSLDEGEKTDLEGSKPKNEIRFQPIHGSSFARLVENEWIIKGVLPKAELGVVFGDSGSGKTFKLIGMSVAVATGVEWRGRKVQQGAVVYVCAEDAGGFSKRLFTHAQHYNLDLTDVPLHVIPAAPSLLLKTDALDVAKAILSLGVKVSLVVIDTLAKTIAGGNENSSEDVGLALLHCAGIHKATGAMVLLVHHSGKDTSKGARGWSGLRAACDVEMEVVRFDQERVLTLSKQKNGEDNLEFGFKLTTVSLGFDSDGDEITSCVAEPTDGTRQAKRGTGKKLGHNERLALRCMGEMMCGEGEGVQVGQLLNAMCAQMLPPDEGKKDRRREMGHRAIQALQDSGQVALNERGELIMVGGE